MSEAQAKAFLRRKCFALARELALSDEERRELSMMLPTRPGHDPVSWSLLTAEEYLLLSNWLDGARLVLALYRLRA